MGRGKNKEERKLKAALAELRRLDKLSLVLSNEQLAEKIFKFLKGNGQKSISSEFAMEIVADPEGVLEKLLGTIEDVLRNAEKPVQTKLPDVPAQQASQNYSYRVPVTAGTQASPSYGLPLAVGYFSKL